MTVVLIVLFVVGLLYVLETEACYEGIKDDVAIKRPLLASLLWPLFWVELGIDKFYSTFIFDMDIVEHMEDLED